MAGLLSILAGTGINALGDIGRVIVQNKMAESAAKRLFGLKALLGGLTMESPEAQMAAKGKLEEQSGISPWPTVPTSPIQQMASQVRLLGGMPTTPGGISTPEQLASNRAAIEPQIAKQRSAGLVPTSLEDLIISRLSPETTGEDVLQARDRGNDLLEWLKFESLAGGRKETARHNTVMENLAGFKAVLQMQMFKQIQDDKERMKAMDKANAILGQFLKAQRMEDKAGMKAAGIAMNTLIDQYDLPYMKLTEEEDPRHIIEQYWPFGEVAGKLFGVRGKEAIIERPYGGGTKTKPSPKGMPDGYEAEVAELEKLNLPPERKEHFLKRIKDKYGVK